MSEEQLRNEVDRLRQREQRLADLIGCTDLARLEHDLRNVLNELVMLRKLAELDHEK